MSSCTKIGSLLFPAATSSVFPKTGVTSECAVPVLNGGSYIYEKNIWGVRKIFMVNLSIEKKYSR